MDLSPSTWPYSEEDSISSNNFTPSRTHIHESQSGLEQDFFSDFMKNLQEDHAGQNKCVYYIYTHTLIESSMHLISSLMSIMKDTSRFQSSLLQIRFQKTKLPSCFLLTSSFIYWLVPSHDLRTNPPVSSTPKPKPFVLPKPQGIRKMVAYRVK